MIQIRDAKWYEKRTRQELGLSLILREHDFKMVDKT